MNQANKYLEKIAALQMRKGQKQIKHPKPKKAFVSLASKAKIAKNNGVKHGKRNA